MTAVCASAALSGCNSAGNATPLSVDRTRLVSDLAAKLERSTVTTYTADYLLRGGAAASVTRAGNRTAYSWPGGRLIITPTTTTTCTGPVPSGGTGGSSGATGGGPMRCTTSGPAPTPNPTASSTGGQAVLLEHGMISVAQVENMLTAASLDSDAVVTQRDTTIAGRHATCVEVRNAEASGSARFDACVTDDGILGSFAATPGGTVVDMLLSGYRPEAPPAAFTPPPGSSVTPAR